MNHSRLYLVNLQPFDRSVVASPGSNLLDAVRRAGIHLTSICSGQGECGECRVIILEGQVSRITGEERESLSPDQLRSGMRLACCTWLHSSVRVQIGEGFSSNEA